jgi:bile acid:Na+ symporter, BASS family
MKDYLYTICIILAVTIAYNFPQFFLEFNGIKSSVLILPMLQIIMFGMGTTVSAADFAEVFKSPKSVIIGLICQFIIMPSLGFLLAHTVDFPAEIAAGILLIGCSPSGLASNVMCMIAKANVALSVTITTLATLISPFLTPLLMKFLGGGLIEINFWNMVWDITKIVIIPIGLGYILNQFFGELSKRLQKILPYLSMIGIGIVIVVVTASGQKSLQTVGGMLIVVVLIHNIGGYLLGYTSAKLLKMSEQDCRTVALEVGMQNGGLASGLANQLGKIATLGLAAALFGPIMNITGSILSSWWSRKPPVALS